MMGDLALGQAPVVGELECLPFDRRQPRECVLHLPAAAAKLGGVLRAGVRRFGRARVPVEQSVTVLAADEVDGASMHEREDPASGRAALRVVHADSAPEVEKRVLDGVLGEIRVPDHAQGEPERGTAVAVREPRERFVVTLPHLLEQDFVSLFAHGGVLAGRGRSFVGRLLSVWGREPE